MATQHIYSDRLDLPVAVGTGATVERGRGIIERQRERSAQRKQARLMSARNRRMITSWLRRTARRVRPSHPLLDRRETLLQDRVEAVRSDLLEIAALLERAQDPDPACVLQLHELLANGCDSPLYNPIIHVSELHARLHGVRVGLTSN